MKKFLDDVKRLYRHNQFFALALVVVLALSIWLIGCESSVTSPINPPKKVTRPELNAEIEYLTAQIDIAVADLDKQDLFKQKLFEIGLVAAQGGTVNPVGAGVTLLGILGIGAVADNRKKDSVIKTLQKKNERA